MKMKNERKENRMRKQELGAVRFFEKMRKDHAELRNALNKYYETLKGFGISRYDVTEFTCETFRNIFDGVGFYCGADELEDILDRQEYMLDEVNKLSEEK
jgi:hypothetical protein